MTKKEKDSILFADMNHRAKSSPRQSAIYGGMDMSDYPTRQEQEALLQDATQCLACTSLECHEFTPGGVDVCAKLPFWNGQPVPKAMLLEWRARLDALHNANRQVFIQNKEKLP